MKYEEKCMCGACHWQAHKVQHFVDEFEGKYTTRYRQCCECGRKVKTIQWEGLKETKLKDAGAHKAKIQDNQGMKTFIKDLVDKEKPRIKLDIRPKVTVEHNGETWEDECPSLEEALDILRDFFG